MRGIEFLSAEEKLTEEEELIQKLENLKKSTQSEDVRTLIDVIGGILGYIADGLDKHTTGIAELKIRLNELENKTAKRVKKKTKEKPKPKSKAKPRKK